MGPEGDPQDRNDPAIIPSQNPIALIGNLKLDDELKKYKLVDTDGQPFADAGLSEREDNRQLGANNFWLAPHFIKRLAHLGWGFGPSISALGLQTAFDHDNSPVSVHKTYSLVTQCISTSEENPLPELNMPDDSWNPKGSEYPLRRPFERYSVPNVCAIDMDTTGTWPFAPAEDQVATRFLSMFLDHGRRVEREEVSHRIAQRSGPVERRTIELKTVLNPMKNDKEFLTSYLADPW